MSPLPRNEFPVTERYTYLNHAAVGVLAASTKRAIDTFVEAQTQGGVLGTYPYEDRMPEFRSRLGQFIGAGGNEVAFLRNTSHGANVLAGGIPLNPGDEVLLCDDEFPANVIPWLMLREQGVNVRLLPVRNEGRRLTPEGLRREMTARTKLVTVSWVNFADGYRHDLAALAEIAHAGGAFFVVDAIQGLGAFPLDVRSLDVDAIFASAAKWLLALHGIALLYVRENLRDRMRTIAPGWRSVEKMWDFFNYDQPLNRDAWRFEGGAPNFLGALSFATSIDLLERSDKDAIAEHVLRLTDRLYDGLRRLGATILTVRDDVDLPVRERILRGRSSGIIAFSMPEQDTMALGKALQDEEKIVTTRRSNVIRVSPHGYNTLEEIDALIEAIEQRTGRAPASA